MRKTTLIFLLIVIGLTFVENNYAQPVLLTTHRDIAVVGHNQNHPNNIPVGAPNSGFSGFTTGGNALFQMVSFNPPDSYFKNKITGNHTPNCQLVNLLITDAPSALSFDGFGGAHLLFGGAGGFGIVCGTEVLVGTFNQAVLHVANGSNSASITLLGNTVNYLPPTNVITNQYGSFSWLKGTLSIAIITERPVVVSSTGINPFLAYSNVVFGASLVPPSPPNEQPIEPQLPGGPDSGGSRPN